MSVGTKVSLVVGVLFAAVLAFYYGIGSPPVNSDLDSVSNTQISENPKQLAAVDKSTAQLPTQRRDSKKLALGNSANQRRGLLSESVQRAVGSSKSLDKARNKPLNQIRMGESKPKSIQNNLAKDSGLDLKTVRNEPKAVDPLAVKTVEKPKVSQTGKPKTTSYTVKENDSMWTIAKAWFGDGSKWELISKANPYVDPDRLKLGQILQLPSKDLVEGNTFT